MRLHRGGDLRGVFLFDPPAIGSFAELQAVIADEEWVLHAASQDLACLREVGLDPSRVYQVRSATLDRSAIHISLEDGTIGFTQDVMGRVTGAFFEGDGEVELTS